MVYLHYPVSDEKRTVRFSVPPLGGHQRRERLYSARSIPTLFSLRTFSLILKHDDRARYRIFSDMRFQNRRWMRKQVFVPPPHCRVYD